MPVTGRRRRKRALVRSLAPALVVFAVVVAIVVAVSARVRPDATAPEVPIPVVSGEWAPFVGADLHDGGPVTQLVTEVMRRAGYAPQVTYTSWSLAQEQVSRGAALAAYPLVSSEERRTDFELSDPLLETDYVLFYNAATGRPDVSSEAAMGELRVGGIAGYDYWPAFDAAASDRVEFATSEAGFEALADGRIDLLAEGEVSGRALLASPDFAGDARSIRIAGGDRPWLRSRQPLHLMVARSAESAKLLDAFNSALAELKATDRYDELVASVTASPTDHVRLATSAGGLVPVFDERGRRTGSVPAGSEAVVRSWPDGLDGRTPAGHGIRVKIKITTGPGTGTVGYVRAADVELVTP